MVIDGYLSGLSRPEQVVYFVREVLGLPVVSKEVLSQRTGDYRDWVEAYARNHHIPIEWAEKGVRKRRLRVSTSASSGAEECVRGLFHLQEHGTGAGPSASASRNIPLPIRTVASWPTSAAVSRTTTSISGISGMRFWGRSCNRSARVERPFWFIERNFLVGRKFGSWEDLNQQARQWSRPDWLPASC